MILDITAIFGITRLGLWEALELSGFDLVVPASVPQSLRWDRDWLRIERLGGTERLSSGFKRLVALPMVEIVEAVAGDSTFAEADERLCVDSSGAYVYSFADGGSESWTIPELIDAAEQERKLTHSQSSHLRILLAESIPEDRWHAKLTTGSLPASVLLSGPDLECLCRAGAPDAFLALFDKVIVGPGALFLMSHVIGPVEGSKEAEELAHRCLENVEAGVGRGRLKVYGEGDRPDCTAPQYLPRLAAIAQELKGAVWTDDSAMRHFLAHEAPGSFSLSTVRAVLLLRAIGAIDDRAANDLGVELVRDGYRDVSWSGALLHAAKVPAHHRSFDVVVRRLCVGLKVGFFRNEDDRTARSMLLFSNLWQLVNMESGAHDWLSRATGIALGFRGTTVGMWWKLFDNLASPSYGWAEEYVDRWAREASGSGVFDYELFIEAAMSAPSMNGGFPLLEAGRDHAVLHESLECGSRSAAGMLYAEAALVFRAYCRGWIAHLVLSEGGLQIGALLCGFLGATNCALGDIGLGGVVS